MVKTRFGGTLHYCALLTVVSFSACGFLEKRLLQQGESTPLTFQKVNFSAGNSAQNLVFLPRGFFDPLLNENKSCFGSAGRHKTLIQSMENFQDTALQQEHLLRIAPFLPSQLPEFPEEQELLVASDEFLKSKKPSTPRSKVHETVPESVLLRRLFSEDYSFSGKVISSWQSNLQKTGVKLVKSTGRSFYARSLEPKNLYQWLVSCAKMDVVLPDGTLSTAIWPLFVSLETGTGTKNTSVEYSFRPEPEFILGENSFTFLFPEKMTAELIRNQDEFSLQLSNISTKHAFYGMFYRENANMYLGRYASIWEKNREKSKEKSYVMLSFQSLLMKSLWKKVTPKKENDDGIGFFNESCSSVNSSASSTFTKDGIHYIDQKSVQSNIEKLSSKNEMFSIEVGQAVCKVVFKN